MRAKHDEKISLRKRILAGEPVFGTFGFLPDPALMEIMGLAGLDFVIIDLEHSPKDWQTVENMVRAAELHALAPLVRVHENNEKDILHALEIGAQGIMVPFLQTAEEARQAGSAVRYPPLGTRGSCTLSRASGFGARRAEYQQHTLRANEEILLIGLLESMTAVDNIEAIVESDPGPDVFVPGRSDLAASIGKPGQLDSEEALQATERILSAVRGARQKKRQVGIGVYGPEEVGPWYERGVRFFAYSSDTGIFYNALHGIMQKYRETLDGVMRGGNVRPMKRST
jgi:2-keto-3-deoxy-L-rhamnonate aldolase RhmA